MKWVIYKKKDGTTSKYAIREVKRAFFTRYGIFDGDKEITPEDRGEKFVKYEE